MNFLDPTDISAASEAVGAFVLASDPGDLPAVTWSALNGYWPSPADKFVNAAEALYGAAQAGAASAEAVLLGAQLTHYVIANGLHILGQTERGPLVLAAFRRMAGELTEAEAPAELDPPARLHFVIPVA